MSPTHSGFPTLEPAIICKVNVGDVNPLGVTHTGSTLTHYGTPTGTMETVEGFSPAFKANIVFGADWLSFDPDQEHARINLKGVAKTDKGHSISFGYKGVIALVEDVKKVFNMQPGMATVPFGYATGNHTFVVADPALKALEHNTFSGNGRLVVQESGLSVESRIARVVPSTVMD